MDYQCEDCKELACKCEPEDVSAEYLAMLDYMHN